MIPGGRENFGQALASPDGNGGTVPNLGNRITLHTVDGGYPGYDS